MEIIVPRTKHRQTGICPAISLQGISLPTTLPNRSLWRSKASSGLSAGSYRKSLLILSNPQYSNLELWKILRSCL